MQVGDEIDPVTKGPIGLTDEIAYVASGAAPIPRLSAHRVALKRYRKHNRELRACEPRDLIERARDICRFEGLPL